MSICLVAGALLGVTGTFVSSPSLRSLAWGIDGAALVTAGALLCVHHFRRGRETVAAGFLVFIAGQTLMLSGAAMSLEVSVPSFAAGASPGRLLGWAWATSRERIDSP